MVIARQSSRKGQSTNNTLPKRAPRNDFKLFKLSPELRNLIYSHASCNSSPYYLEDLGVITFHTIGKATAPKTNVFVPLAVHGLLCASKEILVEVAALALETIIIDVGVRTRIDLSMLYDRDLPVANAL